MEACHILAVFQLKGICEWRYLLKKPLSRSLTLYRRQDRIVAGPGDESDGMWTRTILSKFVPAAYCFVALQALARLVWTAA